MAEDGVQSQRLLVFTSWVGIGLRFEFDYSEKVITTPLLWNTMFFENSMGSDWVICLHVDTKMSIEMFVDTQILDI